MVDESSVVKPAPFVARYGGVYEHSPWVAQRTLERGAVPEVLLKGRGPDGRLHTVDEARLLGAAMAETMASADERERRALILAHPDLVGRAALAGDLTDESTTEQSSAGLDSCTPDELDRFQTLNATYRERFGFPFIMAVRGAKKPAILAGFQARIDNDPAIEFANALREIDRIALLRLESLVEAG